MVTTYLRRAYSSFATHVIDIPPRLLAFLLFLLLLTVPITIQGMDIRDTFLSILTIASITAIYAASWDLLVGRCGLFSLGHALFFGAGAYCTVLLNIFFGWPIWVTIPLSMFICVLIALLIGIPALRVKGPYFALVTMAVPLIAAGMVLYFDNVTGGDGGISTGIPSLFPSLKYAQNPVAEYYFAILLLAGCGIVLYKIANSRMGIVMVSILDDELASKASGINTTKYKLLAFSTSALFAGLAGAVYAHWVKTASHAQLAILISFNAVIITVMGGIGTIYGPIVASFILEVLNRPGGGLEQIFKWLEANKLMTETQRATQETYWHMLIFITLVVVLILKWPRGIARFTTDKLEDLAEEREIEERGPHIWKKYGKKKKE